jgi:hypothetical protein
LKEEIHTSFSFSLFPIFEIYNKNFFNLALPLWAKQLIGEGETLGVPIFVHNFVLLQVEFCQGGIEVKA